MTINAQNVSLGDIFSQRILSAFHVPHTVSTVWKTTHDFGRNAETALMDSTCRNKVSSFAFKSVAMAMLLNSLVTLPSEFLSMAAQMFVKWKMASNVAKTETKVFVRTLGKSKWKCSLCKKILIPIPLKCN